MVLGSMVFYAVFAYDLQREDFPKLLSLFAALFFLQFKLIQFEKWNVKFLVIAGILFRLVFLIAEPNLSQDFYRFIWDGELIKQGINPYLYTPDELMQNSRLNVMLSAVETSHLENLHNGMGDLSARHYSNYPPINQILFAAATFLGMGKAMASIIWLRLVIIGADIGILFFGRKLLQNLNLSPHLIFWYFINPLVIIELTGNLHFEGVMLFLFVWAIQLMATGKYLTAAPIYAASILLKLIPLLFLPLFLKYLGVKKAIVFYVLVGASALLFIFPFFTQDLIDNYGQTIGLWFSNFEFNASIYNLVKRIGVTFYDAKPWELIKSYGAVVKVSTTIIILLLTFLRKNKTMTAVIRSMFYMLCAYYILSTTVHPWYVVFLVVLGLFTNYRFAILWSALIVLSYFAYSQPNFEESLWLLSVEYLFVFGFFFYEFLKNHNIQGLIRKKW
jgi:hypothetical protein